MRPYLLIAVFLLATCLGCTSQEKAVSDSTTNSQLKNIRSDLVITYCEKDVKAKHIAALEWFDANEVGVGVPSSKIERFLSLALVKKPDKKGVVIYKFPLAPPAGNHVLNDEPRAEYNHYFVRINQDTGLVEEKGFRRYTW